MATKGFPIESGHVQAFLSNLLDDGFVEPDKLRTALFEACIEDIADEEEEADGELEPPELVSVCSFREAGLLTRDCGVVLRFACGREFQLTVVRSR